MVQATDTQTLIRRILRVDHAGEHGAVSIYTAQIGRLGEREPELRLWLEETMGHEIRHRDLFREAMPDRDAKPCRAMAVWSVGGGLLGGITAMLGRRGILACTAAVERTVHGHLIEQIAFLKAHDSELAEIVADILEDEIAHLDYAQEQLGPTGPLQRMLETIIGSATEVLISISTRGDSWRLSRTLNARAF